MDISRPAMGSSIAELYGQANAIGYETRHANGYSPTTVSHQLRLPDGYFFVDIWLHEPGIRHYCR